MALVAEAEAVDPGGALGGGMDTVNDVVPDDVANPSAEENVAVTVSVPTGAALEAQLPIPALNVLVVHSVVVPTLNASVPVGDPMLVGEVTVAR
jgi:hypothetical protein